MDLHDEIGQTLTTIKMEVELMSVACGADSEAMAQRLQRLSEKLSSAMEQVRRIAYGLRPSNLDALGLESALGQLVKELNHHDQIHIRSFFKGLEERCPKELEVAIYRIVQEGLTNAIRHSRAKNIFVNAIRSEDRFSIVVEDDGVGFDPEEVLQEREEQPGLGWLTMRERAGQFGGTIWVESHPGRGTLLTAEIPLGTGAAHGGKGESDP
jgi:two-component system sensor histidine kinase UhpB